MQGRGVASAATSAAVAQVPVDGARRLLHAFPSVANAPSHGVCRRCGFTLVGPVVIEYPPGSLLRCNDWRLDLRAG